MKTANATAVASATSCTSGSRRKTSYAPSATVRNSSVDCIRNKPPAEVAGSPASRVLGAQALAEEEVPKERTGGPGSSSPRSSGRHLGAVYCSSVVSIYAVGYNYG